jgi:hypothetical protein
MVKLIPPVNFCSDENIQTIFAKKLEDFLDYHGFTMQFPMATVKKNALYMFVSRCI